MKIETVTPGEWFLFCLDSDGWHLGQRRNEQRDNGDVGMSWSGHRDAWLPAGYEVYVVPAPPITDLWDGLGRARVRGMDW